MDAVIIARIHDMNESIIYEDECIKLIYLKGSSNNLIITFGDLVTLAEGNRFFADKPIKKLGYSALGFMAKGANWYPSKSMGLAIETAIPILPLYAEKILYGGSMGGYAALKYSKALQATLVISQCPQWSIDPIDCNGNRSGYEKYFTPEMSGMGIMGQDLAGKIYLFVDKKHSIDLYHATEIIKTGKVECTIHIPRTGHHVTSVLAGMSSLQALIESCLSGNINSVRLAASGARRSSLMRSLLVLDSALLSHPKLVSMLMHSPKIQSKIGNERVCQYCEKVLLRIDRDQNQELTIELAEKLLANTKSEHQKSLLESILNKAYMRIQQRKNISIKTHHNTYLAYNLLNQRLEHHKHSEIDRNSDILLPVYILMMAGMALLSTQRDGVVYFIAADRGDKFTVVSITNITPYKKLITANLSHGVVNFPTEHGYLSARLTKNMVSTQKVINAWELFEVVPK